MKSEYTGHNVKNYNYLSGVMKMEKPNGFEFAKLSPEQVNQLAQLEAQLNKQLDRSQDDAIILLAVQQSRQEGART